LIEGEMKDWDEVLRQLADQPSEYEREGGAVMFVRHGKDIIFNIKQLPGVGPAVELKDSKGGDITLDVFSYVQREILDLPRLASQIVRALDRNSASRPVAFIDGPAEVISPRTKREVQSISKELHTFLIEIEPGTTRLVQLMGQAGQGKTVLLEELARRLARGYQPSAYPTPLLLPIDLLGRYVGTIDDAIAGSLNNTYLFPGMNQRDVALCIRTNLIVLALDGFDELVARIGPRDAFQRITELLDQLNGAGTVILSARESFFELYQISAAIRSYLQPKTGSYSTEAIRLLPWAEAQGVEVFRSLGSSSPEVDLEALLAVFGPDRQLVLQPFFITRLAQLWMAGERFEGIAAQGGKLSRTRFLIDKFITRETELKWKGRDEKPLLSERGHTVMLAGIAEEMWRSNAFRLTADELRLACQIALQPLSLPKAQEEAIVERVPTHAAFLPRQSGYAFIHDRFIDYYFGYRLAELIASSAKDITAVLLKIRELSPDMVDWVDWRLAEANADFDKCITFLIERGRSVSDQTLRANVSLLLGHLLARRPNHNVDYPATFIGDVFAKRTYIGHEFADSQFWQLDLRDSVMHRVRFNKCVFAELVISTGTDLAESTFESCTIPSLEIADYDTLFSPEEIREALIERGAEWRDGVEVQQVSAPVERLDKETVRAIQRLVSKATKTSDVCVEEFEDDYEKGGEVIDLALDTGILKSVARDTSGPKKSFVRFRVDRDLFLRGGKEVVGNDAVDAFWRRIAG
jgi:hypothetical protein